MMWRIPNLLRTRRYRINLEIGIEMGLADEVGEYALCHGGTADIAVADKEHFYHCCITSHFLVFLGISGFVSLCKFLLSGITLFIFA